MTPATLATHSLPLSQQFEAWHAWYASVFETSSRRPEAQGFRATTTAWTLNGFGLSCVASPSILLARTGTLVRHNPVDHWCISVGKKGVTALRIGERALVVSPGVPFVLSLGEETHMERDGHRIQLYLTRDDFQAIAPLLDGARGTVLDSPEGRLLADYMLLLERNIPHLPVSDGPKLARAIQAMVGACLAPSADRLAEAGNHIALTMMDRVRQAVARNLRSPSLSPEKLCREAATSRSQLYRLLEPEGGVAHYILRRRLSESFSLLSDSSTSLPIGKVAEMLCFADGSSFSRAFRREFGMSPRDVRASAVGGLPPMAPPTKIAGPGLHSFSECLRNL
jgi:AraC-like DNA-binding protein